MLKYIILIISFLFINNVSYSKELAPAPKVIPIPAYQTWMSIIQQGSQKKNNLLIR